MGGSGGRCQFPHVHTAGRWVAAAPPRSWAPQAKQPAGASQREPRPSLRRRRRPPGMPRALAEVEPQAAVPNARTEPRRAHKAAEAPWSLRSFTASLIKFRVSKGKKRNKDGAASSMKKAQDLNENVEGPCGLGFIVLRTCQRFNTISCFLFFYCLLSMSQGERQGVGWRGGTVPLGALPVVA